MWNWSSVLKLHDIVLQLLFNSAVHANHCNYAYNTYLCSCTMRAFAVRAYTVGVRGKIAVTVIDIRCQSMSFAFINGGTSMQTSVPNQDNNGDDCESEVSAPSTVDKLHSFRSSYLQNRTPKHDAIARTRCVRHSRHLDWRLSSYPTVGKDRNALGT